MNPRTLQLYIGEDDQIWAQDPTLGVAYKIAPATGRSQNFPPPPAGPTPVTDAPADGNEYVRQNGAWIMVPKPGAWLPVAVDSAWAGAMYCRQGTAQDALQIYGGPTLRTGKLQLSSWTLVGILPTTVLWPPTAKAFLAPAELTSNAPDYCFAKVDTNGQISVMPSSNNINQVLIDVTITLK